MDNTIVDVPKAKDREYCTVGRENMLMLDDSFELSWFCPRCPVDLSGEVYLQKIVIMNKWFLLYF